MILLIIFLVFYVLTCVVLGIVSFLKYSHKYHWSVIIISSILLSLPFFVIWILNKRTRKNHNQMALYLFKKLNKQDFKYHLLFGTLLFAIRENNFSDDDIDLGVFKDDFVRDKWLKFLASEGFVLKEEWLLKNKTQELSFHNADKKIQLDVYLIDIKGSFTPAFDEKNNRYSRRPTIRSWTTIPFKIKNIIVNVPNDTEEWLKWNYGNWQVKTSNYHWFYGPKLSPTTVVKSNEITYKNYVNTQNK